MKNLASGPKRSLNRKAREEKPQRSRRRAKNAEQPEPTAVFLESTIILSSWRSLRVFFATFAFQKVLFQLAPRRFRLNEKYAKNGIPERMTSSPYPEFGQSFLKV